MKKDELVLNSAVIGNEFKLDEPNTIVFSIDGEEMIKINEEGFYYKGKLVEDDKEIYHNFKEWVDLALKEAKFENDGQKKLNYLVGESIDVSMSNSAPTQSEPTPPINILESNLNNIKMRLPWIKEFYEKDDIRIVEGHIGQIGESLVNILKLKNE